MIKENIPIYSRKNPYLARIKQRFSLCGPGSHKKTEHISLDLSGSGISYATGDSIGILPQHDHALVQQTLEACKFSGSEVVVDREGAEYSIRDFLTAKGNITDASKKLLNELHQRQSEPLKKARLAHLLNEMNKEELKQYLNERFLWDILLEHSEIHFTPQALCDLLMPLLPRLYSIASSNKVMGEEIHLTVALLEYTSNGYPRHGVCTHYLCNLAPMEKPIVPVYIQPNHGFTIPQDSRAPMIMIGPGTGIAPFRAFMQERLHDNATGKHWLFFGEWHRSVHFYYEPFWQGLIDQGKLRMDVAFSRDQGHKIYVQHRMLEQGAELYQWLEEGAYLYVCGDAQKMAKDVEATLALIIQKHGCKTEEEARQYIKQLRQDKRYLRDVY